MHRLKRDENTVHSFATPFLFLVLPDCFHVVLLVCTSFIPLSLYETPTLFEVLYIFFNFT